MAGGRKKRVGVKRSSKVDWLSILPESLLCKVFLNLPSEDVVRTSVLSKRWRNLWKYVPGLDLDHDNFPHQEAFVSFVDVFLGFNSESYLESFKLNYNGNIADYDHQSLVSRWINIVVDRRVKHLVYIDDSIYCVDGWDIQVPPTLYTCDSIVSLKLNGIELASPKFVSLPCLKFMDLTLVHFEDGVDLETLILGCPVLENLYITSCPVDYIKVLRVCSQSLLRFTLDVDVIVDEDEDEDEDDPVVEINATRLQYLRLGDSLIGNFILNNLSSLVEAYIDTYFNWSFKPKLNMDLQKRMIIRSFLEKISSVKNMTIGSRTLEVIYRYSKCEQLPLFRNVSFLRVNVHNFRWKLLPIFFESCTNLKSLVVVSHTNSWFNGPGLGNLLGTRCSLSSLEYVDIETPLVGVAMEMKLVSYFLETSSTLKRLTVRLAASIKTEESARILKELLAIPRLSSCQVIVL